MEKFKFWQRELPIWLVSLILTVLNTILYNIPFLGFVNEHANTQGFGRVMLIISFALLVMSLNFFAFYLLMYLMRIVGKVLIAILSTLSALCSYYIITYQTMMDESMIGNVFNTRFSEASGFLTWGMFLWVIFFGILPGVWVIMQKVDYKNLKSFGKWCLGSIGVTLLLILLNLNQVLWIGKYDTELGGLIMPWSYTVNTGRLWVHKMDKQQEEIILPDAKIEDNEKCVMVLVIGESARKANFSLYGYGRETNPLLKEVENLKVLEATSCATYTTEGTKSILEYKSTGDLYEILPNYMNRTGVDVAWYTSNWGEPPVHIQEYVERKEIAKQYNIEESSQYDDLLFRGVKERILKSDKDKVLIILHTSTSHGPDYQQQYPPEFEKYTPVCNTVEEAEKDNQKLVNAYDNSIIYTDWMLRGLIDSLKTIDDRHCAMMYVSDHGESLGENNLYMHGLPMKFAPNYQYEIPFLVWTDGSYREFKKPEEAIDQHWVFHSVMRWLGVESPVFNPENSLF